MYVPHEKTNLVKVKNPMLFLLVKQGLDQLFHLIDFILIYTTFSPLNKVF